MFTIDSCFILAYVVNSLHSAIVRVAIKYINHDLEKCQNISILLG